MDVFLSTFFGALSAFLCTIVYERHKVKAKQKFLLTTYFHNLFTALRNLTIFANNAQNTLTQVKINPDYLRFPPLKNIQFDFHEEDLAFVQLHHNSFFDSIIQLKIELNTMHEMGELYKETREIQFLYDIHNRIFALAWQIVITMQNVNKYMQKYYKTDLTTKPITDGWANVDTQCTEWFGYMKNWDNQELVNQTQTSINTIKNSWPINFE
jgi:hypothetical protein